MLLGVGKNGDIPPLILNLGIRQVSKQLHAPAFLPPGKNPGSYRIGGWVDPGACLDARRREKSVVSAGIRTPDRPAHTLVTVPTE